MRDKTTGKPRGFELVIFADLAIVDRVLKDTHTIDDRMAWIVLVFPCILLVILVLGSNYFIKLHLILFHHR
ncbi:Heterogeneous nuclear ribonucleoprotein 1 [Platanthera guangdongensis]|uniref:Heterogeneous nuclear ribonucleoprotein 1 n=1 Tax=Platanthera guangdongensis TaxID=2320717 RepID=A0ABR2M591_9ASPA